MKMRPAGPGLLLLLVLAACTPQAPKAAFVPGKHLEEMVIPAVNETPAPLPPPFSGTLLLYDNKPVFWEGKENSWDSSLVLPGAVIAHGGLLHMFYNGIKLDGESISGGIGYAVSTDGIHWYRMANEPLLSFDAFGEVIGASSRPRVSSVLVEDDGTWVLYFSSEPKQNGAAAPSIWRATAPEPNGPWTVDPLVLLKPGGDGEWDHFGIRSPQVVKFNGQYLMFYESETGGRRRGETGIGLAASPDGLAWEKYNDPATATPHLESDPVWRLSGDFVGYRLIETFQVWRNESGLSMIYNESTPDTSQWYAAASADGIDWTRAEAPILTDEISDSLRRMVTPRILYENGRYLVYFYGSADHRIPNGKIYLAVSE